MAISNLSLSIGYQYKAESTSAPDNGNNSFTIPWGSNQLVSATGDEIELDIIANGASVTAASFVSFTRGTNTSTMVVSFAQSGADTATVIARYVHSLVR